ncbi:MAG: ATP-dependent Clp protease proteolytic subunit [Bacteroidaceae bacterium]|nr:ATP-dependent Clp protease proteolytic subunit [Bacteroidaceae bacterium]
MGKQKFLNVIPGNDPSEAVVLLYGEVGDGERVDSSIVVSELLMLERDYKKIAVHINSVGGDVFSGMAIYGALKASKSAITIYVDGVAASIAAIIALCGKPLYMSPYAKLMLHSVKGGTFGNASDLRKTADMVESLEDSLSEMIAGKCGMTKEEVKTRYFDETDHWLNAQEALEMKLIDGIYEMPDENAPSSDKSEDIYQYFNNRLVFKSQKKNDMAFLDDIKTVPSFADVADENAAIAKIKELEKQAGRVAGLEDQCKALQKTVDNLKKQKTESFINQAIADGKITEAQKDSYMKLMAADEASTMAVINGMKTPAKPVKRAKDFIDETGADTGLAQKSWDELDKAGQLMTLKNQNKEAFCAKFKEKFGTDYIEE